MATATSTRRHGSSGCGPPEASSGPIVTHTCDASETTTDVYVLARSEVAAVSVAGGQAIPTHANPTLPDRMRAAAVELIGRKGQPEPGYGRDPCPQVVPLDVKGRPIARHGSRHSKLLQFTLPDTERWNDYLEPGAESCDVRVHESGTLCQLPTTPPSGVCQLTARHLPTETTARWGAVATQVRSYPKLLGRPLLLSCVETDYFYLEEHALDSAVLLDAAHPGSTPPPLPGMKPLAGHPGIFEAPGCTGEMVARRVPGAWLVVDESDEIGLRVPVELIESLHAEIHLPTT